MFWAVYAYIYIHTYIIKITKKERKNYEKISIYIGGGWGAVKFTLQLHKKTKQK